MPKANNGRRKGTGRKWIRAREDAGKKAENGRELTFLASMPVLFEPFCSTSQWSRSKRQRKG
jgi:hypothetical protein